MQYLWPNLIANNEYDIFHEEISYPKFTIIQQRNPFGSWFADCENLKFSIHQNQIPSKIDFLRPSILVECKECPASDSAHHVRTISIKLSHVNCKHCQRSRTIAWIS